MTAWWLTHLRAEGSTRSAALMRITLVCTLWSRFAGDLLLFHHSMQPSRWALSLGFFATSTCLLMGWFTRTANVALVVVLWVMYAYWGFRGQSGWMHHHTYLLVASITWLACTPSGRSFSVDRWLAVRRARATQQPLPAERGPTWGLTLLALQCSAVYLFSAYDKTQPWFLSGGHLVAIFQHYYTGSDPITLPAFAGFCQLLAIVTVVLEYVLPIGLFVRRWQRWLVPIGLLFHAILYVTLPVATFSVTMWILYLAYLDPDAVHDVIDDVITR